MAIALGIALLFAGEWLKRSDDKTLKGKLGEAAKALQGNASVPGLLSAVGIFSLLGASYAAHELYNLIPATALVGYLLVVGFAALGVSHWTKWRWLGRAAQGHRAASVFCCGLGGNRRDSHCHYYGRNLGDSR